MVIKSLGLYPECHIFQFILMLLLYVISLSEFLSDVTNGISQGGDKLRSVTLIIARAD